jgi:hypothetical protein
VTVIVVVLLLTLGLGWLRGGSLEQLATMQLRWAWLVGAATALTVLGAFAGRLGLPAPGVVYVSASARRRRWCARSSGSTATSSGFRSSPLGSR